MAIDFPNSPSNGDIHTVSGKRWQWDGEKWQAYGASLAANILFVDQANSRVGINDTTPTYGLDVNGTARVTGVITASGGVTGALTGNADTATALATARTIGGVSFDGTANIAVTLAATATALATARTIGGVSFDGTGNIDLPGVNAAGNQNTSGTAATVTTAAQSAITSLGTLTSLSVSSGTDISPDSNGAGQFKVSGNGYAGFIAKDATAMHFGHNSSSRGLYLMTDETTRLAITGAGNVGIGTTSPARQLSAKSGSDGGNVVLVRTSESDGAYGGVEFHNHPSSETTYRKGALYYRSDGNGYGRGDFLFCNNNDADGGNVDLGDEVVRITAAGNVGIGTTTPGYPLEVYRTGGNYENMRIVNTAAGALYRSTDSVATTEMGTQAGSAVIRTANTVRLAVTAAGNVGIGATAPAHPLHVGSNNRAVCISDAGGTNYAQISATSADGTGHAYLNLTSYSTFFKADGNHVMAIRQDGNVGIGTTSPTHKLHAAGASFLLDGKLYLGDNAGSVSSVYNLYSNSSNLFLNAASGSAIYNRINNTTQMQINAYGASIGWGDTGADSRMTLRVAGENIFMSDKTTIGRTSSGAMAIFGHNVYASTTANNTVNCADANYYGQFMRMYHAYGITFHVSTAGHSADAVVQNTWTGASSTNNCDEAVVIGRSTQGGWIGIRGYGANEGGQLQFFGGSSYGQDMYFDRYNNDIRMIWGGVQKVGFANTGNIQNSNNSYGALSDERLKTDITPARNYLADLLNLEVVNFVKDKEFFPTKIPVLDDEGNPTYRPVSVLDSDGFETYDADGMPITADGTAIYNQSPTEGAFELLDTPGIKQLGLIAQQVEPHLPGLVEEDMYGVKAVKYSVLVPMLLQAVQTLTARVTELESA